MVKRPLSDSKRSSIWVTLAHFLVYFLTFNSVEMQGSLHQGKDYIQDGVTLWKIHVLGRKASLWSQDSSYKLAVTVNNNLSPLLELRLDFKSEILQPPEPVLLFIICWLVSDSFGTPWTAVSELKSIKIILSHQLQVLVVGGGGGWWGGTNIHLYPRHGPLVSSAFVKLRAGRGYEERNFCLFLLFSFLWLFMPQQKVTR